MKSLMICLTAICLVLHITALNAQDITISVEYGPPAEADTWELVTIPLTAETFGIDATQFNNVMSNVTQFRIRTEMRDGDDIGAIDEVSIAGRLQSDFAGGTEEWSAAGDGTMEWIATGGNPGGYLQISDWASGDYHWAVAPVSWSGDWSSYIAENIQFYVKTNYPSYAGSVEISNAAVSRLILSAASNSVRSGQTLNATISLSAPAVDEVVVTLNSSSPSCLTSSSETLSFSPGQQSLDFVLVAASGLLDDCNAVITATAGGFQTARMTINVTDDGGGGQTADLQGKVTDATTGAGIAGAIVSVAGISTYTDHNGDYIIIGIPVGDLSANFAGSPRSGPAPLTVQFTDLSSVGYQTVTASAEGYYSYETNLSIPPGDEPYTLDISLSPQFVEGEGEMRLVLNWGMAPEDLDLFLQTPEIEGTPYQVSWMFFGNSTAPPYAILDHDDMESLGPETITIYRFFAGTYQCFVHNYSGANSDDKPLTESSGIVQIYDKTGLLQTLYVPTSGTGNYWYVCDIDGATGRITIKNTIEENRPTGSLTAPRAKEKVRVESIGQRKLFDVTSWAWDFDNNGSVDATVQNPIWTYEHGGSYTVKLTVSDGVAFYSEVKTDYITVSGGGDVTPPGPVTDLTAALQGDDAVRLTWRNPTDTDFAGTAIVRSTEDYPDSRLDGVLVYEGTQTDIVDAALTPGTTYYYSAFAYDTSDLVSYLGTTSRTAITIPAGPSGAGYRVNISTIDATAFPTIKCFASVVDSVSLSPVTGLTKAHFMLQEDRVTESLISVEEISRTSDAKADIAFVFDVTGSMGDEIDGLKQRALNFADALAERGVDYRLALVTYGDSVRHVYDFTSNADLFKSWVDGLVAHGGGDTKENALEALARAASLSFRAVTQRMTILITDADYHEIDEGGNGTTLYTTESMVGLLIGKNITSHVVGPNYTQFHQLSEGTGGLFFNISEDFQAIVDLIGNIISSQYVITYTTHKPSIDNTWRSVFLSVSYLGKGGANYGRYYIGGKISNVSGFYAYGIASDRIVCRWFNPPDTTLGGVVVLRNEVGYPSNPTDGTVVYEGTGTSFVDFGLAPATIYYYGVFAYNYGGLYSDPTAGSRGFARTYLTDPSTPGSWVKQSSPTNEDLRCLYGVNENRVFAAGDNGIFLATSNGGSLWGAVPAPSHINFLDMAFVNNDSGWAVGRSSSDMPVSMETLNGGNTWMAWASNMTGPIYANEMVSDKLGWHVGTGGQIEQSIDGGVSSVSQISGVSHTLRAVSFVNGKTGWVAGDNGTILKTSNSGGTWIPQTSGVTSAINDLYFYDAFHGWACTEGGQVLRSNDGGSTWIVTDLVRTFLSAIHFSDPENGFTVGGGGAIFVTENGGLNWSSMSWGGDEDLRSVFVLSPKIGWIVGDNGTILKLIGEDEGPELSGYRLTVSSIDAESFPVIRCFVSVVDATSFKSVTGLTADFFRVKEDGIEETLIRVEEISESSGAKADIVFVFDITGSMGDEISGLKERSLLFADALAMKGIDYRLGLVTYSDEVEQVYDFTADANEFKSWIDGLRASGGGDTKENALEGLDRAVRLSFRATTQRIGVLITDADYHEAGESGDGSTTYTTQTMINMLREYSIVTNVVGPDLAQFHQIAELTGGFFFNIDGDFGAIVDDIGGLISSQYVVTYTTHNPVPTAAWRNVMVIVENADLGGYDTGRYYVGGTRVVMNPADVIGIVNTEFSVDIGVENIINLGLANFTVSFNASKLQAVSATNGGFLDQGGASSNFIPEIFNDRGTIEISTTRMGTTDGVSGTGLLCSLRFRVLVTECESDLDFSDINFRQPDNTPISLTKRGTHVSAAVVGGVSRLLGDFDKDLDIDTRDFALLSTYWKPTNSASGDIGPAVGTPPMLTPVPDGTVNFEDLFVFTRMWNWFHVIRPSTGGGSLAKSIPQLEWRVNEDGVDGKRFRAELWASALRGLAMGHLLIRYDGGSCRLISANEGGVLSYDESAVAFLVDDDDKNGLLDIAFARLAGSEYSAEIDADGRLAVFEFERTNLTAMDLVLEEADLRSASNSGIALADLPEVNIDGADIPMQYELCQNYPNPFNSKTSIEFRLPQQNQMQLTVLNVLGQPVRILIDRSMDAGRHRIVWDGRDDTGREVVSGIYLVHMKSGAFKKTREILFLK